MRMCMLEVCSEHNTSLVCYVYYIIFRRVFYWSRPGLPKVEYNIRLLCVRNNSWIKIFIYVSLVVLIIIIMFCFYSRGNHNFGDCDNMRFWDVPVLGRQVHIVRFDLQHAKRLRSGRGWISELPWVFLYHNIALFYLKMI